MAVTSTVLVEAKYAESAQTAQYAAPTGVTVAIDKCTVTNVTATPATISINIVPAGSTAVASNLILDTKTLLENETYTCPEIVGQVLAPGDFVSTVAGTASALVLRMSGRLIS